MKSGTTIGFVLDDSLDRPDGVQQYVLTLGEWLRSRGHDVHYLVSESGRTDIPQVHSLSRNVAVRFNGNGLRIPLPAPRGPIADLIKRIRFDILHVQMPFSPFLAGRVIQAASDDTAVVGTFHIVPGSPLVSVASKALALWCRAELERFDAIVSVSEAAQTFALNTFGINSSVIPNMIDVARFRRDILFSHKRHTETCHILYLGRLVPRKGCFVLLKAVSLLARNKALPPFKVTICGKGPLSATLQEYVHTNNLMQYVTFAGFVTEKDKPRYYASSDITVFPSKGGESFGIVLLEAMASGSAVVLAGDNAGYRCVLGACPGDVLFDPCDPVILASKISHLLVDQKERRHIADWQYQYVERYDVGHVGAQLERMYASALRRRCSVR